MADLLVFLRCPACAHTWHSATIRPGMWWAEGETPEKCAKACYCAKCQHPPPMQVVGEERQERLFE